MGLATTARGSVLLAAVLGVSAVHADGECAKGFRDTTAVERQTMLGVMEAAKAALPGAPEGWIIGGYEELSPVGSICIDGESTPWEYGFSRTFNRADDQAARDQALADAGAAVRAAQEARQPRIDALMAKMQTLGAELGPAAQKGDQARVEAIQRELDGLSKQFEAIASPRVTIRRSSNPCRSDDARSHDVDRDPREPGRHLQLRHAECRAAGRCALGLSPDHVIGRSRLRRACSCCSAHGSRGPRVECSRSGAGRRRPRRRMPWPSRSKPIPPGSIRCWARSTSPRSPQRSRASYFVPI